MITYVNAKINIGLYVIGRRPDGYHDLRSVFYPIGVHNGTPENPQPFCDVLEITERRNAETPVLTRTGNVPDCAVSDDLTYRALQLYAETAGLSRDYVAHIDKHLPFGAGLGGGSADATFVLRLLNELEGGKLSDSELAILASRLGADCTFFVYNRPALVGGVGDKFDFLAPVLAGKWAAIVKPNLNISTKEAFRGVRIASPDFDITEIYASGPEVWRGVISNAFEDSLFPAYPVLADIKQQLYDCGAVYASMSGSGSALYGIFDDMLQAVKAAEKVGHDNSFYNTVCLL